jgi:hypothetical protein
MGIGTMPWDGSKKGKAGLGVGGGNMVGLEVAERKEEVSKSWRQDILLMTAQGSNMR